MPRNLASAVATVDDVHKRNERRLVEIAKVLRQPQLFVGQIKRYEPFDDQQRNQLPDTVDTVQVHANQVMQDILNLNVEMWNVAGVRDMSNMTAAADVVVDGHTIIKGAPVPFLLYLRKQLDILGQLVAAMPVRDPAEEWRHDPDIDQHRTEPVLSHRTGKVFQRLVLHEGNEHHAPQVQPHWTDEPVGTFHTTKFTSAWPQTTKRDVLDRVTRLADAVKRAYTEANRIDAATWEPGQAIAQYLWPATKPGA